MDTKVFTMNVAMNSRLDELTRSANQVLSQIFEHKNESSLLVMQCEHMADCDEREKFTQDVTAWEKVLRQLEMANAIIVYSSEGDVFGHSFDLLLIADYRIIPSECQLGFLRRTRMTAPGMSLYRLTNQIGQAQARRLSIAGKALKADEAYSLGLADELSNSGVKVVDGAIGKFSNVPSLELAIQRRLLLEAHTLEYDDALGAYWAARARHRSRTPE